MSHAANVGASSLLFLEAPAEKLWDTWIYYHEGRFYLYYLTREGKGPDGVGLAISSDGIHWDHRGRIIAKDADVTWLGSGAVWPSTDVAGGTKFIMNFSQWRDTETRSWQTMFFAESSDLINWARPSPDVEFIPDERWYEAGGRWDNIWAIPRKGGGYHGYWTATPKDGLVGLGFGESDDGLHWRALAPALLPGADTGPASLLSPEVSAVHPWGGQYYALPGMDDLGACVNEDFSQFWPGHTTFIGQSPSGPFHPAPKNRRLLVGNNAYFLRFVETADGLLANHHSWERAEAERFNVDMTTSSIAPLKAAHWDVEGTLRLKWWGGNDRAKSERVAVDGGSRWLTLDPERPVLVEGEVTLSAAAQGLFLHGSDGRGTAFLFREDGRVEYGDFDPSDGRLEKKGEVDRELPFGPRAAFRLLRKGRITELYLNDFLMQCYCLPENGSGQIELLGEDFSDLEAWYCG